MPVPLNVSFRGKLPKKNLPSLADLAATANLHFRLAINVFFKLINSPAKKKFGKSKRRRETPCHLKNAYRRETQKQYRVCVEECVIYCVECGMKSM